MSSHGKKDYYKKFVHIPTLYFTIFNLYPQVLERARKAEAEAAALKAQIKNDAAANKKAVRDLETAMSEAAALSQKSERESLTLRESFRALTEGWKNELKEVREEMRKRDEFWKKEVEEVGLKYRSLVKLTQASKYVLFFILTSILATYNVSHVQIRTLAGRLSAIRIASIEF